MKAAYFDHHGGPEVMTYGDLPDPVARPGQVVVDIHAASVNGADWRVRSGDSGKVKYFPYVLGRDFSGVISAVGEGVTDLGRGDAVFGVCDAGQEGAYAEKIAMKAAIVAKKPDSVSHVDAAALALTGLTALISIEDTLKLRPKETILIQGGAGGVAAVATQIAKHIGAHVITTTSAANFGYVKSLGADRVIDYNKDDFTKMVSGCDAVFDTVGGDVALRSFAVVKPGGRAAFVASGGKAPESPRADVASLRPAVGRDRPHLERIVALVGAGAIRPPEIRLFGLEDAEEAQRISEGRHFRGKLVFKVRP
jgi:NADPH:quinone reductase-like Zn-dependent oxidoreductase